VKEAGSRLYKSRDKQLRIGYDRRKGNNWNSTVESVELIKGKLFLDFYIQYENTDTNTSEEYDNFFRRGNFRGEIRRSDRYGNGRTYYFCYDETDKARVMRSILLEYVYSKYNDKLKD
jgi:GTPase SAR1 family protein